jgi:nickel/cobalt exporter
MLAVLLGLWGGALHVLLGPDHLAALAPLTLGRREGAVRSGLRWGLGHAAAVAVLATGVFVLREAVPLQALSDWSERLVGVSLVALGALGLWRLAVRGVERDARAPSPATAWALGGLHGLAGSAHLLGALPALALPTRAATAGYLIAFCAGSLVAMATFSWLFARVGERGPRRRWQAVGAAASLAVGALWLVNTLPRAG